MHFVILQGRDHVPALFIFWMFCFHSATLVCMTKQPASRNPWTFLPTLYFAEGLPYVLVNTVSVILYKRMGIDNASIAFWTSWLYFPWVIKMFWGPFVDVYSTKRRWILGTQAAMSFSLFVIAFSLRAGSFFFLSLAAFCAGAFISATYDIGRTGSTCSPSRKRSRRSLWGCARVSIAWP
jgi:MFS family permease